MSPSMGNMKGVPAFLSCTQPLGGLKLDGIHINPGLKRHHGSCQYNQVGQEEGQPQGKQLQFDAVRAAWKSKQYNSRIGRVGQCMQIELGLHPVLLSGPFRFYDFPPFLLQAEVCVNLFFLICCVPTYPEISFGFLGWLFMVVLFGFVELHFSIVVIFSEN